LKLDIQFFGRQTLYDLKLSMQTIGQQYKKSEEEYVATLTDTTSTSEQIQAAQKLKDELKMRFDGIKEQHDAMEAEVKAKIGSEDNIKNIADPEEQIVKAKAELIKATIRNQPIPTDVKQILGDRNNTGGEKLLPTTMSDQLLMEPLVKNPLREISTYTN